MNALVIDVGNTNICAAVMNDSKILFSVRLFTEIKKTSDQYFIDILNFFKLNSYGISEIKNIIVSSVVPDLDDTIIAMSKKYFMIVPLFLNYKNIPLKINLKNPKEVGADRLVNAYAGLRKTQLKRDVLIIDFGTATTFDFVKKEGVYEGGVIFAGVNLSLEALKNNTAKLPRISPKKIKNVIGRSTVDAITSGIFYGYISLVEGIVSRIRDESRCDDLYVIATGGLAEMFISNLKCVDEVDQNLTIFGIYQLFLNLSTKNNE